MRKILLIIGVVFTVLSAIIFNFVISKNDVKISGLEGEIRKIDMSIDSKWKDRQFRWAAIQNVLLSSQNNKNIMGNKIIRDVFDIDQDIKSIDDLAKREEMMQQDLQNKIDEIFLSRVEVLDEINDLTERNDQLKNLANVLNILGLTLLLVSQDRILFKRKLFNIFNR